MKRVEPINRWRTQRWPCPVSCRGERFFAHTPEQLDNLLKVLADGAEVSMRHARLYTKLTK